MTSLNEVVDLSETIITKDPFEPTRELGFLDVGIQRAACYAFATLAGLAIVGIETASYLGNFHISPLYAASLVVVSAGLIYLAPSIPPTAKDLQNDFANLRFEDVYKKYGLGTLLQTFKVAELKKKFDQEIQDPKTTFWSVIQAYDTEALLKHNIIDATHFELLQNLKSQAEAYRDIHFLHKQRHVLTLFGNKSHAFKAMVALDKEYKSKLGHDSPLNPPIINFHKENTATPIKQIPYIDAKIKQVAGYTFAALAGLVTLGEIFVKFNAIKAAVGVVTTIVSLWAAVNILDYKDPETQKTIRAQLDASNFVSLYREHGLTNLLQVFEVSELKQLFNAEIQNPKITFWNVLRRYDIQELHQAGIITDEHFNLLTHLRKESKSLNLVVFPGIERWKQNHWWPTYSDSYHVHTAFSNEPEAFRMADALDNAYKAQVETML